MGRAKSASTRPKASTYNIADKPQTAAALNATVQSTTFRANRLKAFEALERRDEDFRRGFEDLRVEVFFLTGVFPLPVRLFAKLREPAGQ